jgi:hypothetical protein
MSLYYSTDHGLGDCGLILGVGVNKCSLITTFRSLELKQLSDLFRGVRAAGTWILPLIDSQCWRENKVWSSLMWLQKECSGPNSHKSWLVFGRYDVRTSASCGLPWPEFLVVFIRPCSVIYGYCVCKQLPLITTHRTWRLEVFLEVDAM